MNDCPNYSALIQKLTDLHEQYLDFFTDDSFSLPSISLPKGIWIAEYTLGDRKLLTLWNDTDADFTFRDRTVTHSDVSSSNYNTAVRMTRGHAHMFYFLPP